MVLLCVWRLTKQQKWERIFIRPISGMAREALDALSGLPLARESAEAIVGAVVKERRWSQHERKKAIMSWLRERTT
ncbi:hypothetical protein D3870_09720 [Noviherbaspirillum cavernae]|uniref:Uncharacterized protein n=1 Tax=Noviherbaspirillum cavernae TaxID=2320862 RepID=A0A418X1C4_9BURK|nr:hypothetical protein D3870_09720 [Noviherbaspirillum cavernae]